MRRHYQLRRVLLAALGMVAFLCGLRLDARPAEAQRSATPSATLSLSSEQERRAAALAHFATGISLELRSGLDAAMPEYETALQLDPQNTSLAVRLAQIAIAKKDYAAAITRLEAAAKANPSSADPWLWLGLAHRANEQLPKAQAALRQGLKIDPLHLPTLRAIVELDLQQDDTADAVKLLDQAWKQKTDTAEYWMGLGDLYAAVLKQKPSLADKLDQTRVRQAYEKARDISPRDPDILLRLAEASLEANDYATAAATYTKLLTIRPDLMRLRDRLVYTYLRADQKDKAVALLKDIIKRDPLRFETYNTLADLLEDLDKDAEAAAQYQQSLLLNPNQAEAYVRLTLVQMKLKQHDDALKTLADARLKFPAKYQIPYLRGMIFSEQKQFDKAVAAYAEAEILLKDNDDEAKPTSAFYFSYAAASERTGDTDKAVALFRKSLELDPDNHAAANYLGYMWADKGVHLDEAHDLIKKAVALHPDNGAYLDSLGWVLFKLGRHAEALPPLRRAAELLKEDATPFDHLATVLLQLGQRDEAIAQLKRAIALDPANKEIADKLQKLTTP